jgi:4-hydroxy-2-oxoheptanedioate aldolase
MPDEKLAAEYLRIGFDFVAVTTDITLLRTGADAALRQLLAARATTD